jgi:hypothetical protein
VISTREGVRSNILAISLAVLGVAPVFGAFVLNSYNFGSCPGAQQGQPVCDHTMSLAGITFRIGATANGIFTFGAVVLVISLGIGLYWTMKRKSQRVT